MSFRSPVATNSFGDGRPGATGTDVPGAGAAGPAAGMGALGAAGGAVGQDGEDAVAVTGRFAQPERVAAVRINAIAIRRPEREFIIAPCVLSTTLGTRINPHATRDAQSVPRYLPRTATQKSRARLQLLHEAQTANWEHRDGWEISKARLQFLRNDSSAHLIPS